MTRLCPCMLAIASLFSPSQPPYLFKPAVEASWLSFSSFSPANAIVARNPRKLAHCPTTYGGTSPSEPGLHCACPGIDPEPSVRSLRPPPFPRMPLHLKLRFSMDIASDGSIAVAGRASGDPSLMSIEAVFSISTNGDPAAEGT